jgi:2-keto-4-pentenoate hydratase
VKAQEQTESIAHHLVSARRQAVGLPEYPGAMPASLDEAYAIQASAISLVDQPIIGWKVGRIHPPLSTEFGSDRLAGPIFADSVGAPGSGASIFADGFGAAEAEFLLRIGHAPAPGKASLTLDEAAALIDAVHIGIEIASSPFVGINVNGPAVTISDFGNNNGLIVGAAIENWRDQGLDDIEIITRIDGEVIGTGRASAFPDGIVGSVRFIVENLIARGFAIQPGWWISTGAVTGVHEVEVGQHIEADFGPFGMVTCSIEAQQAEA